jgi:hypothetical protein
MNGSRPAHNMRRLDRYNLPGKDLTVRNNTETADNIAGKLLDIFHNCSVVEAARAAAAGTEAGSRNPDEIEATIQAGIDAARELATSNANVVDVLTEVRSNQEIQDRLGPDLTSKANSLLELMEHFEKSPNGPVQAMMAQAQALEIALAAFKGIEAVKSNFSEHVTQPIADAADMVKALNAQISPKSPTDPNQLDQHSS